MIDVDVVIRSLSYSASSARNLVLGECRGNRRSGADRWRWLIRGHVHESLTYSEYTQPRSALLGNGSPETHGYRKQTRSAVALALLGLTGVVNAFIWGNTCAYFERAGVPGTPRFTVRAPKRVTGWKWRDSDELVIIPKRGTPASVTSRKQELSVLWTERSKSSGISNLLWFL
jgi:hypothetical protein